MYEKPTAEPLDEIDVEAAIEDERDIGPEDVGEPPMLVGGDAPDDGVSFSPEELEGQLEPAPRASPEEILHVEDPLAEAILDEGVSMEGFDEDLVELAMDEESAEESRPPEGAWKHA